MIRPLLAMERLLGRNVAKSEKKILIPIYPFSKILDSAIRTADSAARPVISYKCSWEGGSRVQGGIHLARKKQILISIKHSDDFDVCTRCGGFGPVRFDNVSGERRRELK